MIKYQIESAVEVDEFKEVLINSTLGERRPVDDLERLKGMLSNANLIITARDQNKLVGIARSLSDFNFCTYLSDLAVDVNYQHQGIGRELIKQTKLAAPLAVLILLSAPKVVDYYPKIGMTLREHCFILPDIKVLK